ncbi:MAG: hypothetical protein Q8P50_03205, partial [Bacillota bacterium]|nr:hypothetical protein [Bacillota bacterium]
RERPPPSRETSVAHPAASAASGEKVIVLESTGMWVRAARAAELIASVPGSTRRATGILQPGRGDGRPRSSGARLSGLSSGWTGALSGRIRGGGLRLIWERISISYRQVQTTGGRERFGGEGKSGFV